MEKKILNKDKICCLPNCKKFVFAKEMCHKHYFRAKLNRIGEERIGRQQDGRTKSLIFNIYSNMLRRCCNKNASQYEYYGGRGLLLKLGVRQKQIAVYYDISNAMISGIKRNSYWNPY